MDVLGGGYTIAPPSYREDLGATYRFVSGSLDDLDRLPPIRANALEAPYLYHPAAEIFEGERNNWLWRRCAAEARACDDLETLIDCAQTIASQMPEPLSAAEAQRAARSAWRLQSKGLNFIDLKRPQVTQRDAIMDELGDQTDAYYLLDLFRRWHAEKAFAIAPRAMSVEGNPPWHWTRIARARDVLLKRQLLVVLSPPDRGRHKPGQYRLAGKCTESVHNHLTPSPRLWVTAWALATATLTASLSTKGADMSLKRRIAKVEREHQDGERMFVTVMDSRLREAEQEAFMQAEAERLGVGSNDLQVSVTR